MQLWLQQFREATQTGHLVVASEIAAKLGQEVQRQYRATLVADAPKRVADILSWLRADTESFFLLQSPFVIPASAIPNSSETTVRPLRRQPAQTYAFDRLVALNSGRFFRALDGVTIRLAAAGMSNRKPRSHGMTPALMPDADVTYFYFLDQPVEPAIFGAPDAVLSARPVWKGEASILKAERGFETVKDESWLSLAKPDLLILCSHRDLLLEVLARVADAGSNRALPPSLPEWKHVDQHASFWGLRHFADAQNSNPEDAQAVGVTLTLQNERLRIFYLSGAESFPRLLTDFGSRIISVERLDAQGWLLQSTLTEHGDFSFHVGMGLLGFGMYR